MKKVMQSNDTKRNRKFRFKYWFLVITGSVWILGGIGYFFLHQGDKGVGSIAVGMFMLSLAKILSCMKTIETQRATIQELEASIENMQKDNASLEISREDVT